MSVELHPKIDYSLLPQIALDNITAASLASKVRVITGPASATLQTLPDNPKYDMVFIDADKPSNVTYFTEAKRLVRSGGVIVRIHTSRNLDRLLHRLDAID